MSSARKLHQQRTPLSSRTITRSPSWVCSNCRAKRYPIQLSTKSHAPRQSSEPFRSRLRDALRRTKIQWGFIPAGLGIAFLGVLQLYRLREREKGRHHEGEQSYDMENDGGEQNVPPDKRQRIRPSGPW